MAHAPMPTGHVRAGRADARQRPALLGEHSVLECVGPDQSTLTAISIAGVGGGVGRVGVPQDETMPASQAASGYLTGIAVPMIIFGIGQRLGLRKKSASA